MGKKSTDLAGFWLTQLQTMHSLGDGIVIWGSITTQQGSKGWGHLAERHAMVGGDQELHQEQRQGRLFWV